MSINSFHTIYLNEVYFVYLKYWNKIKKGYEKTFGDTIIFKSNLLTLIISMSTKYDKVSPIYDVM